MNAASVLLRTSIVADMPPVFCPSCPRLMLLGGGDFVQSFFVPNLWSPDDLDEILVGNGLIVLNRIGVDITSRLHELPLLTKHMVRCRRALLSPTYFYHSGQYPFNRRCG
jgi:hypothetical protein